MCAGAACLGTAGVVSSPPAVRVRVWRILSNLVPHPLSADEQIRRMWEVPSLALLLWALSSSSGLKLRPFTLQEFEQCIVAPDMQHDSVLDEVMTRLLVEDISLLKQGQACTSAWWNARLAKLVRARLLCCSDPLCLTRDVPHVPPCSCRRGTSSGTACAISSMASPHHLRPPQGLATLLTLALVLVLVLVLVLAMAVMATTSRHSRPATRLMRRKQRNACGRTCYSPWATQTPWPPYRTCPYCSLCSGGAAVALRVAG